MPSPAGRPNAGAPRLHRPAADRGGDFSRDALGWRLFACLMILAIRTLLALLVLGLSVSLTAAQRAPGSATGAAAALGFDPIRLQRLDAAADPSQEAP